MDTYEADAQKSPQQLLAEVDAMEAAWERQERRERAKAGQYGRGALIAFGVSAVCALTCWLGAGLGLPSLLTGPAFLVGLVSFVVGIRSAFRAGMEAAMNAAG